MIDLLKDHPCFNSEVMLWIYNIESKKWESVIDPTFPQGSFRVNIDDQRFLKSLSWLNIGAMLFQVGIDPNDGDPLFPVVFSKEFCIKYQISQDDLRLALETGQLNAIAESARVRNEALQTDQKEHQKKEKERKEKEQKALIAAKVEKRFPKTYGVTELEQLLQTWQPKELFRQSVLDLFCRKKKVELEYQDNLVRIKQ